MPTTIIRDELRAVIDEEGARIVGAPLTARFEKRPLPGGLIVVAEQRRARRDPQARAGWMERA